ncbi:TIGR03943 family putative permease subunit [Streptomyces chiangmaiensis]|uniref:TIGR03943 family protein n=1 Tax=Streptomyces chiangmaiensis TaxID=766497 RepID=A0ABU7FUB6_9ACTN|nr:TIGR03943 family protein [Streptomyces chiangmaiensis]MED7827690.1 TIGR03943 family protein [Streptomyces chiangmaiensis]
MKRPVQVVLLVLGGLGLLRVSLFTDLYLRYVKEDLRPMLIVSGALLLLLGVADAVSQWSSHRRETHAERREHGGHHDGPGHDGDDGEGHGHHHSTVPRPAWLLFLPVLSLLFYAPPALGAYTASREAPKAVAEQEDFDPLPATSPVEMTLTAFIARVQQDRERAIKGRSVRMTGFVTPDKQGGGWYLTRIIFSCCAADAQPVKVRMYGSAALPANTWVVVTGTWHPGGTLGTNSAPVALDAHGVERITRPVNANTDELPLTASR